MGLGAGQIALEEDFVGIDPPLVKLVAQATQSLADATEVALTFGVGSEEIDTNDFHDESTNPTRITPNIEGYYEFYGTLFLAGATTFTNMTCWIRKNGSTSVYPSDRKANLVNAQAVSLSVKTTVYMNGTTDYAEFMGWQDNTASAGINTNNSDSSSAKGAKVVFGCEFKRRFN